MSVALITGSAGLVGSEAVKFFELAPDPILTAPADPLLVPMLFFIYLIYQQIKI